MRAGGPFCGPQGGGGGRREREEGDRRGMKGRGKEEGRRERRRGFFSRIGKE